MTQPDAQPPLPSDGAPSSPPSVPLEYRGVKDEIRGERSKRGPSPTLILLVLCAGIIALSFVGGFSLGTFCMGLLVGGLGVGMFIQNRRRKSTGGGEITAYGFARIQNRNLPSPAEVQLASKYLEKVRKKTFTYRTGLFWFLFIGFMIGVFVMNDAAGMKEKTTAFPAWMMTAGMLCFSIGIVLFFLVAVLISKRAQAQNKVKYGWVDEGLIVSNESFVMLYKWSNYQDILDTPESYILRKRENPREGEVVPKSSFPDVETRLYFLEIALAHLPHGGTF